MKPAVAVAEVVDLVRRARALVFDFDGTLVYSNPIKWRAFETCFAEFPEHRREILVYCRGNHHSPRWEKFRHVYEKILGLPYTPGVESVLQKRFAAASTSEIVAAPEIPGASGFLQAVSRSYLTALLSNTPNDTLLHILDGRGWRDYFQTIQGAPVEKTAWLRKFRERHALTHPDIVFFGDTPEDEVAARAAECIFIAVANEALALDGTLYIRDFTELPSSIS